MPPQGGARLWLTSTPRYRLMCTATASPKGTHPCGTCRGSGIALRYLDPRIQGEKLAMTILYISSGSSLVWYCIQLIICSRKRRSPQTWQVFSVQERIPCLPPQSEDQHVIFPYLLLQYGTRCYTINFTVCRWIEYWGMLFGVSGLLGYYYY